MQPKVDERRQWNRTMAMARIGAIPDDGVNRACLTELDRQARRQLITWAKEIDASISIDAAANLWLRRNQAPIQPPHPSSPAATWTRSPTAVASTAYTAS